MLMSNPYGPQVILHKINEGKVLKSLAKLIPLYQPIVQIHQNRVDIEPKKINDQIRFIYLSPFYLPSKRKHSFHRGLRLRFLTLVKSLCFLSGSNNILT